MDSVTAPSAAIELLRNESLSSAVQRELERRILSGALHPGDQLKEEDIAGELSISRGPVREAFRALESAGLVRTEKNRGVFVRQVSVDEADEIYEVRAGLDELIGRLLAVRLAPADIDELRALLRRMQKAARERSVEAYYPLNLRFHDRLAELTGNRALLTAYRRLVNELHLYRRATLALAPDSFPVSAREHAAIVEALARRDADRAGKLLYEHAIESRERLHATLNAPAAAQRKKK